MVHGIGDFAAIIGIAAPVPAQTIGVILMHGNTDSPSGSIAPLAAAMESAGYLVERPEMCWSYRRRRDRPFLDCREEIEAPIARLTARGARAIVVAGMSQGGIAALAFGARHPGLAGIIALAPAGAPERNIRGPFPLDTTAAIYLSFFDPRSRANMLENTSRLHAPLLWVAGTADRSQSGRRDAFSRAPANPLNRYIRVNADHLGTPNASIGAVLAWLRELRLSHSDLSHKIYYGK